MRVSRAAAHEKRASCFCVRRPRSATVSRGEGLAGLSIIPGRLVDFCILTGLPADSTVAFHNGSFNADVNMVLGDGTAWMVRFSRVGMICHLHADEKVAVGCIDPRCLVRNKTTIPVWTWGVAADI